MLWNIEEAIAYYKNQGAPSDQNAVISLLKEVQRENGGCIPIQTITEIARSYGVKESFLSAIVKRIPSLHLADAHCLELCGGANCAKRAALAAFVEKTYGKNPEKFTVKYAHCMRLCGKGPNVKWDGTLYHQADEALIRRLIEEI